ncbi:LysR substrate-binding domain-containing protein [Tuwongella immobilis]|uniref:: LysR_substrate n=1 Tax=Tuwongella immobilis TaxID=692036 RepID=A0A6C2YUP8_9BACT|nr:LysR substrate-binding domain-containing protein [Tuwongella immobilis]VIP05340.1 : LysR_substrate [Tuwongella immobilis]VTS08036.1 : LysR_substrate [Tuwongella immobilis]
MSDSKPIDSSVPDPSPDTQKTGTTSEQETKRLSLNHIHTFRLVGTRIMNSREVTSIRQLAKTLRGKGHLEITASGIRDAEKCLRTHFNSETRLFSFVNKKRLVGLTDSGAQVLARCHQIHAALDGQTTNHQRTYSVVATAGSVLHDVIPDVIRNQFDHSDSFTRILFDTFVPSRIAMQLAEGRVDLGLAWHGGTSETAPSSSLKNVELLEIQPISDPVGLCVLVHSDDPLASRSGSLTLADLADKTIVYPPLAPIRQTAAEIPNSRRVRVADFPAVAKHVASGLGLGLYPNHPVHTRPIRRQHGIRIIPLDFHRKIQLCSYTRLRARIPDSVQELLDALKDVVSQSVRESRWQADRSILFDQIDWCGEWTLWEPSGNNRFRSCRAIINGDLTLTVEGTNGTAKYSGRCSANYLNFCLEEGTGYASLTFTLAIRHEDFRSAFLGTAVRFFDNLGSLVQPVVLTRNTLRASEPYWIADRLYV